MRSDEVLACHRLVVAQKYPDAWRLVNKLLDETPDSPECLYLGGCVLRGLDHPGMALPLLAKALSKERGQPNLWMQYGSVLHDLNKWDEAREAFRVVADMLPTDPMPLANIGAGHVQQGKWREAIEWCDRALALGAENHVAHISKGFSCLALGRWKDAWEHAEYLYGQHVTVRVYNPPEREEPMWDGSPGKAVVVVCDQGVGDILMFSQCLLEMQKVCRQVIVECAERMAPVFRRNFPGITVYGTLKQPTLDWPRDHEIDAHIHISYLGRFYRNKDADFPRKAYIMPDADLLAKWREWLAQFPRPWLGVAWQGGVQQTQKHLRSIELADYAPVLATGGTVFDLSYHDSGGEVARWNIDNAVQVVKPPIGVKNFDDTIAFVAALDEVVCVTTTVAHVCGALGRKALVLVPEVPTWRYAYRIDGGEGLIWYPANSVQLYRRKPGEQDWTHTIKRVADDLKRVNALRRAA